MFRIDFENNPTATTTIAKDYYWNPAGYAIIGTLYDYNTTTHDVWQEDGKFGTCGDFNNVNDKDDGASNDCVIKCDPALEDWPGTTPVFDFGSKWETITYLGLLVLDVDTNESGVPQPVLEESTFIRSEYPSYPDSFWDIYIKNGKLGFRCNKSDAEMQFETANNVNSLGITPKTWHHIAVVIDLSVVDANASKIYIDGLAVDVNYGVFPSSPFASLNFSVLGLSCVLWGEWNNSTALVTRR